MSLALTRSVKAIGINNTASFLATGGTEPYVYSVLPNGAGGTIDATTGVYTSPAQVPVEVKKSYDTIVVTDDDGATAQLTMLVSDALGLFCDIISTYMSLSGRVYLWDQKINTPTDEGLWIAVSVLSAKPFGNSNRFNSSGQQVQSVNMLATLSVDVISRGPAARTRKEEVILALNSIYSQQQQELNGFYVAKISNQFVNLSQIDGPAIPYRFNISVNIQYAVGSNSAVDYFDDFEEPVITKQP